MKILGISGYFHDSAAAIISDGKLIAAVEEERFTRLKHDASFPLQSIKFCLDFSGLSLNQMDAIVFYDKPFLKFERLLETYFNNVPKGLGSFVKAMPVWLKEKMFLKKTLVQEFRKIDQSFSAESSILFTEHHLAHAASAFYPSPFSEAAILTIDAVGEWATASICMGKYNGISILKELHFPDSVGLLYSSFTYFLGFKVNSGEYKLMGLAPYGNIDDSQTVQFIKLIEKELIVIHENGSIKLNQKYFNYSTGLEMIHRNIWEQLFQVSFRRPGDPINQAHCNLALAIQTVTERIILLMAKHTKEITGSEYLCLAGGVALNSVANGKLKRSKIFRDVFIQPAAGDSGAALGAALAANHIYFNKVRTLDKEGTDMMLNSFLGPEFSDLGVDKLVRKYNAENKKHQNEAELNAEIAANLLQGKIVGVFTGRMEFGPRALGNRSILANPMMHDMQEKLNLKIKFRESFRPFAAVVPEEHVQDYFNYSGTSPYMLIVDRINDSFLSPLPENYSNLTMEEKLKFNKSLFPSITHVDQSCRIQTVNSKTQRRFWNLLMCFKELTGFPILINTSFNIRGEPIVNTPEEAYLCLMRTGLDVLVINDFIFYKERQPSLQEDGSTTRYAAHDD